jgi:hypothetical protein
MTSTTKIREQRGFFAAHKNLESRALTKIIHRT